MTAEAELAVREGARTAAHPLRPYRAALWGLNGLGALWFFCLIFIVCADIIGRTFFAHPIKGVTEIVAYSVSAGVFLGLAHTLHSGRFTRADTFLNALGIGRPHVRCLFEAVYGLAGAAIFAALLYGLYPEFVEAWSEDEIVGVPGYFTLTIWPFKLILVVGAAATLIEFAVLFIQSAREAVQRAPRLGRLARPVLIGLAALGALAWIVASAGLSNRAIGLASIGGMLVLILAGMHIGVALMSLSFLGIWLMRGDTTLSFNLLTLAADEYLVNYIFSVVPLFVIMGTLVSVAGIGADAFDVARRTLRRVKGGLGVATVAANAVFAAITGTSIASAALFTKIATSEMLRQGYSPRFAVGVVAGSSVLGMLIPPSLLLIVYGFIAEQSVGLLFAAAIVPGLILAGAFAGAIVAMAYLRRGYIGGAANDADAAPPIGVLDACRKIVPVILLIVLVLGGIYGGIFTPTEAAAAGAAGALALALARRSLSRAQLGEVLIESSHITVSILFLILAANIYSRMLALSGLPQHMSGMIAAMDLGFFGFIFVYILFLLVLGMILDSVSIMLITLPLALPVVASMGGDLIWFGIVTVIAVEVGLLTPPFGIACFVVNSTLNDPRVTLRDIFAGAFPFVAIMLAVTAVLVIFPKLTRVFG